MIKRVLLVVFACFWGVHAAAADPRDPGKLQLASANAAVYDASTGRPIFAKAANEVTPIASLTKLMTAMVVLDGGQSLDEPVAVDIQDFDFLKGSSSRLRLGTQLPRREMLRLALMSSENRAASAVARHYPGGLDSFVAAMNAKAIALGMKRTRFDDPTGLSPKNVSTANDLAVMVRAAAEYPLIREFSTTPSHYVEVDPAGSIVGFNNSNRLVASSDWEILLQKTGYIREAGRCLVMLANVASRPVVIVLLDSIGKYTRLGDAERIRHWLETGDALPLRAVARGAGPAAKASAPGKRVSGGPVRGSFNAAPPRRSRAR
ncbi:MAG: D-alanyl-D-alanine endopeptidase [Burkholderiales bacterium]|nr:D-alanyl-D-alanine endopeptidase [Burkholderiales bacterium]GIK86514.1 MAG: D-alanyl-D-alanine endopeptidase [Betaproteobacteria bacterium]